MALRGDIRPPIPGRHTDLFGNFVNRIDGSALVAADYQECLVNARKGVADDVYQAGFPFSGDGACINCLLSNDSVENAAMAESADDDRGFAGTAKVVGGQWLRAR